MDILGNLNILATIGSFGCVSFALSGIGVKLGKFGSNPNKLGFKYISESDSNIDELYKATAKLNEKLNNSAPPWAKDKDQLKKYCETNQKSSRYWRETSQHCLLRPNVWHKLIENNVTVNQNISTSTGSNPVAATTEAETSVIVVKEKCSYELLNRYADSDKHVNFLIGKQSCQKNAATNEQVASAPSN